MAKPTTTTTAAGGRYAQSEKLFRKALARMPGGVSSPVRSFKSVGLYPIFIKQGQGAYLTDVDGNTYIDYVMSYGPLIAGHAPQTVRAAIAKQVDKGTSYGCCTEEESRLADMIAQAMVNVPMVRFVNSGTEAAMSALRLARGATGRRKIIKCAGCYHGHADAVLVDAGSGAATHGHPSSPGVAAATAGLTIVVPYNDLAAAEAAMSAEGPDIAAFIVEPVCGNMGVILPRPGYLQGLRALCDQHGALLILDEVMTGFRVAYGGAQGLFGVRPDITCLGKIIGGGVPVGAYGGRPELMNQISPAGPIYQAGTLSGNPLAMSAGIATLGLLENSAVYTQLEALGHRLQTGLSTAAEQAGIPLAVQRCGSMITPFFLKNAASELVADTASHAGASDGSASKTAPQRINDYQDATACDTAAYAAFFAHMLDAGVMLPPSQFEAWFICTAHTEEDIDTTIMHARNAMEAVKQRVAVDAETAGAAGATA